MTSHQTATVLSTQMIQVGTHQTLHVASSLYAFVNDAVLPNTGILPEHFWAGFEKIVQDLAPKNLALLQEREHLQTALDTWHQTNLGAPDSNGMMDIYQKFLNEIGYLVPEPKAVKITTQHVDTELSKQAGPQLVVPILNARYAINAANARWGSLYDALYGTDAISFEDGCTKTSADGKPYNPVRGKKVIAHARKLLDRCLPLRHGSHAIATRYYVSNGQLLVLLNNGKTTYPQKSSRFVGYQGTPDSPSCILITHNRLHLEIIIDKTTVIGKNDAAGISDIILESALSTILDLEDSVAVVDADDKVLAYKNWLGILQGTLTETVHKNGQTFTRGLNPDRVYTAPDGREQAIKLPGRSLMFVRNVGHLMTHPAMRYVASNGSINEVPEGIMDGVMTTTIALHDLQRSPLETIRNSRVGSVYIVKPKMHGPTEVAFANELFERVEQLLGLKKATVKLGIMDEERRTSVNLKACIAAASERVAFINTGFLDRTGDEMHTAMRAGVMVRKADMKNSTWLKAYELNNVITGLSCGLYGKAQIGKGMWAMPDLMADMLVQKIAHAKSGANTAWVPSPTAATLHALHYLEIDVAHTQRGLCDHFFELDLSKPLSCPPNLNQPRTEFKRTVLLNGMLSIPIASQAIQDTWLDADKQRELDNNVQGILGYVVRWIDQGIGCSKVPDINGINLMEDRATLRISSQHIANWLHHGVLSKAQILGSFARMAAVVDQQNASDTAYTPLVGHETGAAYQAALDLVFQGLMQPSGYTEPLLHAWRLKVKSQAAAVMPFQRLKG
jgi:malate synthase